jgi:DNA-binding HxlR family transcriptional regulator
MVENRGYGQFCPVALAAEVLAERWTPLVVRELLCGSVRFNDLQRGVPRMSSALLARRLKELQFAGIVERRRGAGAGGAFEYHLTEAGRDLFPIVEQMGVWAQRWLRHDLVDTANLDSDLLMWDIRRNVVAKSPPRQTRYVVEFRLSGVPVSRRRYWLVFERGVVDLCYRNPGFEVDLFVAASLRVLTQIWLGHIALDQAVRDGRLQLDGSRSDVSAFRSWFKLNMFAPAGRQPAGRSEDHAARSA